MTHPIRMAFVVGCLGLVAVGGAVADDAEDVVKAAQNVVAAYNAGDVKKVSSFFMGDADLFGGSGRLLHPYDADRTAAGFAAGQKWDLEWRDLTARVHGNSAVSSGFLFGSIHLADGTDDTRPWRNTASWVKDGGQWKLTQIHTSELKPDVAGAQEVISRYHQAFMDGDGAAARACLADSYARTINQEGLKGDPSRWVGEVADAGMLDEWIPMFSSSEVTYDNSIRFVHTDVSEQSGVVVTRETGSSATPDGGGSWEDVANLWLVVHVDGEWKIAASVHNVME
jgi:ketosteroid isomerase-like protein